MLLKRDLPTESASKYYTVTIAALVILIVVSACLFFYNIVALPSPPAVDTRPKTVVGIVLSPSEDDWKMEQFTKIEQALLEKHNEVMILPASRSQASQIEQIRALIVYQVDVIIFSPLVETGWSHVLNEAAQAGIEVIAFDQAIPPDRTEGRCHNVSFAYEKGAAELIRRLEQDRQLQGEILELVGPVNAFSTRELSRGFRKELNRLNLPIRYSYCADSLSSYAEEISNGVLNDHSEIKLVLAQNAAMAEGTAWAIKAKQAENSKIVLTSVGGGKEIRKLYEEGRIDYLLDADNQQLAEHLIAVIEKLCQNPEQESIHLFLPFTLYGPEARPLSKTTEVASGNP